VKFRNEVHMKSQMQYANVFALKVNDKLLKYVFYVYSLVIVFINSCKWSVVEAMTIVHCVSSCSTVSGECNTK